jgi:hypothetical protein
MQVRTREWMTFVLGTTIIIAIMPPRWSGVLVIFYVLHALARR